jgi:hypothetical protein
LYHEFDTNHYSMDVCSVRDNSSHYYDACDSALLHTYGSDTDEGNRNDCGWYT